VRIDGVVLSSLSTLVYMTDKLDEYRKQLHELAQEQQAAKSILARRTELVSRARKEGMTWREAATILGMTEHALVKASKTQKH
jgi:hypothetical protein